GRDRPVRSEAEATRGTWRRAGWRGLRAPAPSPAHLRTVCTASAARVGSGLRTTRLSARLREHDGRSGRSRRRGVAVCARLRRGPMGKRVVVTGGSGFIGSPRGGVLPEAGPHGPIPPPPPRPPPPPPA